MHPLIAFLSFIFSPADDWLLTQAFELLIDPVEVPAVVESYNRIEKAYPSLVTDASGQQVSADSLHSAQWAEILTSLGYHREAQTLLQNLEADPRTAPELRDDIKLRLGESLLAQGDLRRAEKYFSAIIGNQSSPRLLDAQINLLTCDLARNDLASASQHSDKLLQMLGTDTPLSRSVFPLGLTAFAQKDYERALKYFSFNENDPRSRYFSGLAFRHQGRPHDALAQWQELRKPAVDSFWKNLADFQVAETYFSLGDDELSRLACEQSLKNKPAASLEKNLQFRLASIDFRSKNYESALARLKPLLEESGLTERASTLTAESLLKTQQSKDLLRLLAQKNSRTPNVETVYQSAWSSLYEKDHEKAIATAMEGLGQFYDGDYTPRLLLLQGLSFEHLGYEAEALATFQTIVDSFPDSPSAVKATHWTMLSYMRSNRWKEAVTHGAYLWNKLSAESKKTGPETAFWLGEAHLRLERFEDSEMYFNSFLSLSPIDHALRPYGQFQNAIALAKLHKPSDALAMLDQFFISAKERNKTDWLSLAQIQKGHIYFNDRQYAQAISAYRSADKSAKALFHQGLALYRMDYFTDAIDTWSKVATEFPKDKHAEAALFRSGRTQFEMGLATQAVATFAQFVKSYPASPNRKEAHLQSAHALYNAGDASSAAPLYSEFLSRYHSMEDLVSVTPYLASCYIQMGKNANEVSGLLKGLAPTDTVAGLQWNEGANNYNEKKYGAAAHLFSEMLTQYPSHEHSATAMFYRGESLFLQQKWEEAEAALQNYLRLFPEEKKDNAPLALFHLGVSLFNQDKLLKAGTIFRDFLDHFPDDKLAGDAKENLYLCYRNLGDWETAEDLKKKYSAMVSAHQLTDGKLAQSQVNWRTE